MGESLHTQLVSPGQSNRMKGPRIAADRFPCLSAPVGMHSNRPKALKIWRDAEPVRLEHKCDDASRPILNTCQGALKYRGIRCGSRRAAVMPSRRAETYCGSRTRLSREAVLHDSGFLFNTAEAERHTQLLVRTNELVLYTAQTLPIVLSCSALLCQHHSLLERMYCSQENISAHDDSEYSVMKGADVEASANNAVGVESVLERKRARSASAGSPANQIRESTAGR